MSPVHFLFQIPEFWSVKEICNTDVKTITKHFNRNNADIFSELKKSPRIKSGGNIFLHEIDISVKMWYTVSRHGARVLERRSPMELTQRQRIIFKTIVEEFTRCAEPVGSKTLMQILEFQVS